MLSFGTQEFFLISRITLHFIIHNDFSHIQAALDSVYATVTTPYEIHLTINSGDPADVRQFQAEHPHINLHINESQKGFAANHNAAMQRAQTPYIALLNDDIVLHSGALDTLVQYLESHPDTGLAAPLIENPDGTPQLSVFSDISLGRALYAISGAGALTRHGGIVRRMLQRTGLAKLIGTESLQPSTQTRAVPVVVGAAMVVRRETYQQAGGMDEDTLVYGEEYGWHLRLRQHNWKIVLVAEAKVTHYNPATDISGWRLAEHRKGTLAYFSRYRPRWQAAMIRMAIIGFHGIWALVNLPFNRPRSRDHWRTVRLAVSWKGPAENSRQH